MSDDVKGREANGSGSPGVGSVCAFILAVLVVAACLVGSRIIEWVEKLPVPWPEAVVVNTEFRNVGMPDTFGPFRAVQKGEYGYVKPDQPDGPDSIFTDDVKSALGIGHPIDEQRYPDRMSNWYGSRYYIDTREDVKSPTRNWRMDIYYYTGSRDPAPHVGDICIKAGGGDILSTEMVDFRPLPLRDGWNEGVSFKRILAEGYGQQGIKYQFVEYYVFAVNDRPMSGRRSVKRYLNRPDVTYSYFAKMQFSPVLRGQVIEDLGAVDRAAEEFAAAFLGPALEMLPTEEDVDQAGN